MNDTDQPVERQLYQFIGSPLFIVGTVIAAFSAYAIKVIVSRLHNRHP